MGKTIIFEILDDLSVVYRARGLSITNNITENMKNFLGKDVGCMSQIKPSQAMFSWIKAIDLMMKTSCILVSVRKSLNI